MFVKYIICNVSQENKVAFSKAQEQWYKTKNSIGFIGQIGGWDVTNKTKAHIISFWNSKSDLENFMLRFHDKIFDKNKQVLTYSSISISYFNINQNSIVCKLLKQHIINANKIKIMYDASNYLCTNDMNIYFSEGIITLQCNVLEQKEIKVVDTWKIA